MEMDTLREMIREHIGLEDDFVQKFQDLNRRNSLTQILSNVEKLYEEKSILSGQVKRMKKKLATLEDEKETAEVENQRLSKHNSTLQRNLDQEHAKRKESEHKQTKRIDELEEINEDLRLEKRKLELGIRKQRQTAGSDVERIREVMEENSRLTEDLRQERLDRQRMILELETKEKKIWSLKIDYERRSRILQHSSEDITCACDRLRAVQRNLDGLLERPRMHYLTSAPYDV